MQNSNSHSLVCPILKAEAEPSNFGFPISFICIDSDSYVVESEKRICLKGGNGNFVLRNFPETY